MNRKVDHTKTSIRKVCLFPLVIVFLISLACQVPIELDMGGIDERDQTRPTPRQVGRTEVQTPVPTLTPSAPIRPTDVLPETGTEQEGQGEQSQPKWPGLLNTDLVALHNQLAPGVVSIQVLVQRGAFGDAGTGAGSGFILDDEGHIVTNSHVVSDADRVIVIFFDGTEAEGEVVGSDDDSDLAIVRVDEMPDRVHSLPLADSDNVRVGEWVVAIGNPFGLTSSMTVGIVSALGRTIQSLAPGFSIPQAIQTDAAINPGNSGGPLINITGEVIGVNAQIATSGGTRASAGVGFAIPSNAVRRVAPALIQNGFYEWPWLGVTGRSVNLAIMRANQLQNQHGAYIDEIVSGGPADAAGLRGSSGTRQVNGLDVPVGGDVVIEVDGRPMVNFDAMLGEIASRTPGETVRLTVLRNGTPVQVDVILEPRPANFDRDIFPEQPRP